MVGVYHNAQSTVVEVATLGAPAADCALPLCAEGVGIGGDLIGEAQYAFNVVAGVAGGAVTVGFVVGEAGGIDQSADSFRVEERAKRAFLADVVLIVLCAVGVAFRGCAFFTLVVGGEGVPRVALLAGGGD